MKGKLLIEPRVRSLVSYLNDIENGVVQIPSFQRDFIWSRDDIKDLFDSIKNRYPIGSVMYWQPNIEIGSNKDKIGSYYNLKSMKETIYILDGFQRLSTLFGCLTNPYKTNLKRDLNEWDNYFKLYYDLEEEAFIYLRNNSINSPFQVPVYVLMSSIDFRQYARVEFEKINDDEKIEIYYDRADELSRIFLDYQIACIDIKNANIEEAVEIFSRVNSKGQDISFDWMANALSIKNDFRFGDEIDNLIEELKLYNFDKIDRNALVRCIQSSFGKLYIDNRQIENLAKRKDFSEVTKFTLPKIKQAVKFLFEELSVIDNKLLPYNIQLIFLVDFFKRFENPTTEQIELLKMWFWVTTYSNYFTIYSLANQRRAYNHFQEFLNGNVSNPVYYDNPNVNFSVNNFPDKISMGSVRSKALTLFMLNHSNNFDKVDPTLTFGFKIKKLIFSEVSSIENSIIKVINSSSNIQTRRNKDESYLLTEKNLEEMSKNFLSSDMIMDFEFEDYDDILKLRRKIIQNSEALFIKKYNLNYDLEFAPF